MARATFSSSPAMRATKSLRPASSPGTCTADSPARTRDRQAIRAVQRRRAIEPLPAPPAETFPFAFTEAGRRLELTEATPRPWAHVLANPAGQGMVVSNEGAFYSFAGNARANGLTRWPFDPARAGLLGTRHLCRRSRERPHGYTGISPVPACRRRA